MAPSDMCSLACDVILAAGEKGLTISTAESLTGGMICAQLTGVPGSSSVVRGGIVSYVNDVKRDLLSVDQSDLNTVGPVSRAVALQMAAGSLQVLGTDIAVSVTGIAGPGGAEPGKPVGTVWMSAATRTGTQVAHRFSFEGDRACVRERTTCEALRMLLCMIEEW